MRLLRGLYRREDIVILRAAISARGAADEALQEITGHPEAIEATCRRLGNPITSKRIARRLARGLRCFQLCRDAAPAATTWIVPHGTQFIDEIGYHLPIPPRSAWVRDIFVAAEMRGRRLFRQMLQALTAGPFRYCDALWSDVDRRNAASLKAHLEFGFEQVSQFRYTHLAHLLLIRTHTVPHYPDLDGYRVGRRILVTGAAFKTYVRRHIA